MPSMLSTNGERAMERALGQARYPLWIYTKEEWEDWEKAFDCVEWDNYLIDHPNELEECTEDEWDEYLEGLYPNEIESWVTSWTPEEWNTYLNGPITDRRTEHERNLQRGWYQATVNEEWYATEAPAPPPPLAHPRPIPDVPAFVANLGAQHMDATHATSNTFFANLFAAREAGR
jgi:hypothetical protein